MTEPASEYVLGTDPQELARLGQQHRLWSDTAQRLWRKAGVRYGMRVLDIGCGPGFASFDLAQLIAGDIPEPLGGTPFGCIVGVDESPRYVDYYNEQARCRGLKNCHALTGDVQNLPHVLATAHSPYGVESGLFDLAYARWVFCFVADPARVVAGVAAALSPGARFCIHEYFNYETMTMAPRRASHDKVVAATAASWRSRGGDPDIAGRLPRLLKAHGFRVDAIEAEGRIARGRNPVTGGVDPMFAWPNVWWRTFAPKLCEMGLLSKEDMAELFRDLDEIAESDTDFIVCPPVFEILATRL